MSDPVTNVEIEDVLSSIRKLVSEDSRQTPSARKPERLGRLVLTPDQRVQDDTAEPARASEPVLLTQPIVTPETSDKSEVTERAFDDIPRDARLAEFGDVEGAFPDFDTFDAEMQSEDAAEAETEHDAAIDAEHGDDGHAEVPEDHVRRSDLSWMIEEEVAAALGVATSHDDDDDDDDDDRRRDWSEEEADTSEVDVAEGDDETDAAVEAAVEDVLEVHAVQEASEDVTGKAPSLTDEESAEAHLESPNEEEIADVAMPADRPVASDEHEIIVDEPQPEAPPQTLEEKVAALGRLVARGNDEFEEERDRPDADELAAASEPMTWPEEAPFVEAEEPEEPVGSNVLDGHDTWSKAQPEQQVARAEPPVTKPQPVATPEPAAPSATEDDPFEIDEAILRELVGDIVRKELQGALGERITRNVRKLVRREIHRMLISQEFD